MNEKKIYEMIAKTPGIRAVQISDAMDEELAEVSRALREMVECGDVVQTKGTAPNGCQAMVYELSDDFKKTKEYRALTALIDAEQNPAPAAPLPPLAPLKVPVFTSQTDMPAGGPMSERGVAFIVANGSATESDVRDAMGLGKGQYPVSYLNTAVRAGKVHKDGGMWRTGRKPAAFNLSSASKKADPVAKFDHKAPLDVQPADVQGLPPAVVDQLSKPAQAMAAATPAPEPAPAPAPAPAAPAYVPRIAEPVYRCALWSDGVLELQRDGITVCKTTRREHEMMAGFLGRMLGQVGEVVA